MTGHSGDRWRAVDASVRIPVARKRKSGRVVLPMFDVSANSLAMKMERGAPTSSCRCGKVIARGPAQPHGIDSTGGKTCRNSPHWEGHSGAADVDSGLLSAFKEREGGTEARAGTLAGEENSYPSQPWIADRLAGEACSIRPVQWLDNLGSVVSDANWEWQGQGCNE